MGWTEQDEMKRGLTSWGAKRTRQGVRCMSETKREHSKERLKVLEDGSTAHSTLSV